MCCQRVWRLITAVSPFFSANVTSFSSGREVTENQAMKETEEGRSLQ